MTWISLKEFVGSILLTAIVVGSKIMAEPLAAGNAALALRGNTGATVAVLAALIALFGPVSGCDCGVVLGPLHLRDGKTRAITCRERFKRGGYSWLIG